jgi:hypothetical protein
MSDRRGLMFGAVAILLVAGGLAWFLSRGGGLVDETLALQRRLLAGESSGRERKADIDPVIRNVDKMSRNDVKAVRDAFTADWRRLQQAGIEEYAAAAEEDREPLLDRELRRIVAAGELWFATNPRSSGRPPSPPRPRPADKSAGKAREKPVKPEVAAAIERFESYRAALVAQAGKHRVSVPQWLLVSPRR